MVRALVGVIAAALMCGATLGQSTVTLSAARPVFDIADVHASPKSINTAKKGPVFRNGRYEAQRVTMLDLISAAYGIDAGKVAGGPNWLDFDRFDVIAKAPSDTKPDTLKLMLQTLLADRFHLSMNTENRPQPQYALSLGKGKLQLKQSNGSGDSGCRPIAQTQPSTVVIQEIRCQNITTARLAATLSTTFRSNGIPGNYLEGPVVDSTGLTGTWDLDFKVTPPSARLAGGDGDTLFEAMDKLGLKLERRDAPAPALAVDHVNEEPTANPPGVTEALAPAPAGAFEVASIKPVAPGSSPLGGTTISPSGLVTLRNRTLGNLITLAWDIGIDALAGTPKFVDTERFDVMAQAPAAIPRPLDIDAIRPMLRALLAERFGLVVHEDKQLLDVYALTTQKSGVKMERGNDAERGSCKSTPEALRANSGLSAAITCKNTTMPQLADRLRTMAPAYIDHPAIDETGLGGAWDFVLMWTGLSSVNGRVNAGQPGDKADALAQLGSLTVFEAIEKELGLKLALQKRLMPVLVIDHVDQKPTDN